MIHFFIIIIFLIPNTCNGSAACNSSAACKNHATLIDIQFTPQYNSAEIPLENNGYIAYRPHIGFSLNFWDEECLFVEERPFVETTLLADQTIKCQYSATLPPLNYDPKRLVGFKLASNLKKGGTCVSYAIFDPLAFNTDTPHKDKNRLHLFHHVKDNTTHRGLVFHENNFLHDCPLINEEARKKLISACVNSVNSLRNPHQSADSSQ